jgi:DNA-binding helix-hairpin-helix protein with protein kinase domain
MASLKQGDRLRAEFSGVDCVIGSFVGEGGQGSVYFVTLGDLELALKLYLPNWLSIDKTVRDRLQAMIALGTPSERYLWPIDLVSHGSRYGYLMARRPGTQKEVAALLSRRMNPSFRSVVTAGFELADSFHELHARGLSYQDISAGNVFMDEGSGEIRICDCDNVSVNNVPSAIKGTPGYIAPEVGLGRASPNSDSDRFSLAVLLFEMLMLHHPLLGKRELAFACLDNAAAVELFYQHPVFIFDPVDQSNAAVAGYHDRVVAYWALYPSYLHELFLTSFTLGLRAPGQRVLESTWRRAMLRLRDSILICPKCGAETFYDGVMAACWNCSVALAPPLVLEAGQTRLVLNTDTLVYPHHLDPSAPCTFERPIASVRAHPTLPNVFGLRNESARPWTIIVDGESPKTIAPSGVVPLVVDIAIDFGTSRGRIAR